MTLLSVNVNKIATLRNSRGGNVPNVEQCAQDILSFGAHGITVHPRPDGRHIRTKDVYNLRRLTKTYPAQDRNHPVEFNVEGYPSEEFLKMIEDVRPEQCTLVPDPPDALTSNAGWKVQENAKFLKTVVARLRSAGVRSSIFIDPFAWSDSEQAALLSVRPDRVELYTERYATYYNSPEREAITRRYAEVGQAIAREGIDLNAGHDLNLQNIRYLIRTIPEIKEVSIGHALIAEALYLGFKETIRRYLAEMA